MYKITIMILAFLVAACIDNKEKIFKAHKIEFRMAEQVPGKGYIEYQFKNYNKKFFLHKEVLLNNDDILNAEVIKINDEFIVQITFNQSGKKKWAEITGNNIGKNIAMLVNNVQVTCPIIQAKIDKGIAIINGGFSKGEAEGIANGIVNN